MPSPAFLVWWSNASVNEKKRAVAFANEEVPGFGATLYHVIPGWMKAQRRAALGLPTPAVDRQLLEDGMAQFERKERLRIVLEWRDGREVPPDVRRCKHARCRRFFLVPKSRPGKLYHSPKCGRNFRASKCMNAKVQAAREQKLERVRTATESFGHLPDWKQRVAGEAGVTPNFVSYAIGRKELRQPGRRPVPDTSGLTCRPGVLVNKPRIGKVLPRLGKNVTDNGSGLRI